MVGDFLRTVPEPPVDIDILLLLLTLVHQMVFFYDSVGSIL